jgi:hypothetical protein
MTIMYEYLVDIDLPIPLTEELLSLVPAQREVVNRLMSEGTITSYALSIDSGKLWVSMIAESEQKITELIGSFPIFNHIFFTINKLTFQNSINFKIPHFSLN